MLIELAGRRSSSRKARRHVREIGENWGLTNRACESAQASGLVMVGRVARVWGCTPATNGGKIVWAVLDAGKPGLRHPTTPGG